MQGVCLQSLFQRPAGSAAVVFSGALSCICLMWSRVFHGARQNWRHATNPTMNHWSNMPLTPISIAQYAIKMGALQEPPPRRPLPSRTSTNRPPGNGGVRRASDPNVHRSCPTGLEALQDAYSKTATIVYRQTTY